MTWRDGQTYCRRYHTDLAIIENAQENAETVSVSAMLSSNVWIGLYRVSWRWSDKSSSSFRNWISGQPNNYGNHQHCAAENARQGWHDLGCNDKIPFWCYKGKYVCRMHCSDISFCGLLMCSPYCSDIRVKVTLVRMNIQTFGDISEPATNSQILQQVNNTILFNTSKHFSVE